MRYSDRPAIRWALSPDFYNQLYPHLVVEGAAVLGFTSTYASDERVRALFTQVFQTWEANSPSLRFVDVTDRCAAENLWMPVDELECYSSPACTALEAAGPRQDDWQEGSTDIDNSTQCSFATCYECERADVVIGGFHPQNRDMADHVQARVVNRRLSEAPPLLSNGQPLDAVSALGAGGTRGEARGKSGAFLQFNLDVRYSDNRTGSPSLTPLCWRLDSGTCDWLAARRADDPYRTIMIVFIVTFTLVALIFLFTCIRAFRLLAYNLLKGWDLDHDGRVDMQEVIYVLDEFCGDLCFECKCPTVHSRRMPVLFGWLGVTETIAKFNMSIAIGMISFLIAAPLAYFAHAMPCAGCLDLRAAAAHEVGHLLMLGHPEAAGGLARTNTSYAAFDCLDAGASFAAGTPDADSLMGQIGVTAAADATYPLPMHCPTNDDLDGLNFVYPPCSVELREPQCTAYGGDAASWLRLVETWWHFTWPFIVAFVGLKFLVVIFLFFEHRWASHKMANDATETFRMEYEKHKASVAGG